MDLATVIGFIGAFGIVGASMVMGGSVLVFVNVPSMLIVFVGSFMVVMMKFGLGQFLGAFKIAMQAFFSRRDKPVDLIQKSVELAGVARKSGLLALEEIEIENTFLKKGIAFLVDGLEAGVVRATLLKEKVQAADFDSSV